MSLKDVHLEVGWSRRLWHLKFVSCVSEEIDTSLTDCNTFCSRQADCTEKTRKPECLSVLRWLVIILCLRGENGVIIF